MLFSISAAAETRECFKLLENPANVVSIPAVAQRQAANSLALSQLKPKDQGNIHQLNATIEIAKLSKLNLERLTKQIRARFQSDMTNPKVEAALKKVDFVPLRLLDLNSTPATLQPAQDFYNILTDSSRTVGFRWTATLASNVVYGLRGQLGGDFAKLNDELAREQGFVLPHFTSVFNFISFFDEWDRPIIERVIRHNRFNLPAGVDSPTRLMAYLENVEVDSLFPATEYYLRLAPLRQQLHRYLLTFDDAKTFSLLLLKLHILNAGRLGEDTDSMLEELKTAPNRVMEEAFVSIGWEGLELRAPLSIEPAKLSILRLRETQPRDPFALTAMKPFTARHNDLPR